MNDTIILEEFNAGVLSKGAGYNYFIPEKINKQWIWNDSKLNTLLEKASIGLGQLNSFSFLVPNIDLFIQLHVTKEAVISSRIEGTQTQIDEAFLQEEDISPERRNDWREVNNYTEALNFAVAELEKLPLSSRLLRKTHEILLQGVRGEHKQPGEYRRSQNWIGGSSPDDAVFVPPAHTYVNELMGDLENFLHNDEINVPALIRIAIAHYQFETIHPFLDGNGRIGRLMITLFLVSNGMLDKPLLYLSDYFERNKGLYYDNLTFVRQKNDMLQWIKYFLTGIIQTSEQAKRTFTSILKLKAEIEKDIQANLGRRADSAFILLQALFKKPVVRVRDVEQICSLSYKAAASLVSTFEESGILKEHTGQSRNRLFMFQQYLKLF